LALLDPELVWAGCLQVLEGEGGEGARTERGGAGKLGPKNEKGFLEC